MTPGYRIRLPIGDWSNDGHGRCDWFTFLSNVPVATLREIYFDTVKKYPDLDPCSLCEEFDDDSVDGVILDKMTQMGFEFSDPLRIFDPEDFARYVLWFLSLGDPSLRLELEPAEDAPMLCGESKGRFMGQLGYGLFS